MSSFEAIAGVSATLRVLLQDRMELPLGMTPSDVQVTVTSPRPDDSEGAVEDGQVNLFLYRVTENGCLKNQEIPGHGHPGSYGHPPLSLDLHYLLTAYGTSSEDGDLQTQGPAQLLLGSAMRVLHDHPVVTDSLARVRPPIGEPVLHPSLRGEFEQVKLSLDPMSLEDLSKVWTALSLRFRVSAAYTVSVVQIESRQPRRFPKPVGEPPLGGPRVVAVPFRSPHIQALRFRRPGDPPTMERTAPHARVADTLIVLGSGFGGTGSRVVIEGLELPVTPQGDGRIELVIPDASFPDGATIPADQRLQPGAQSVGVVTRVTALPQTGFPSNRAVFMLVPRISALSLDSTVTPRTLTVQGDRLFLARLTGEALVGPALVPKALYTAAAPDEIRFALPDTLPSDGVRCLVSGDVAGPVSVMAGAQVQVEIGPGGFRVCTFPANANSLDEAARQLEAAIRAAPGNAAALRNTRVLRVATRLVIVPAELGHVVTVAAGTTADALELTAATGARTVVGYFSGDLSPFPALTASPPAVRVSMNGTSGTGTFGSRPTTLADAAAALQAAIRAAGAGVDFAQAVVIPAGTQLLVLPGGAGAAAFQAVPGGDQTTVAELRLRADYPVRVRVNGAESLDDVVLTLPS